MGLFDIFRSKNGASRRRPPRTYMMQVAGGTLSFTPMMTFGPEQYATTNAPSGSGPMMGFDQDEVGALPGPRMMQFDQDEVGGGQDLVGALSTGEAVAVVGGGLLAVILVASLLAALPFAILFHYWKGWTWGKSLLVGFGASAALGVMTSSLRSVFQPAQQPAPPALPPPAPAPVASTSPATPQAAVAAAGGPVAGGIGLPPPPPRTGPGGLPPGAMPMTGTSVPGGRPSISPAG